MVTQNVSIYAIGIHLVLLTHYLIPVVTFRLLSDHGKLTPRKLRTGPSSDSGREEGFQRICCRRDMSSQEAKGCSLRRS
jgi:hypothetical protein